MASSTGDAYVDELLSYLQTLPPSVNPYTAAVVWLSDKVSPPTFDNTYQRVTIAFACVYGLQFLALTGTTIILMAGESRWFVRWTPDGFWQPNPKLTGASFCAAFCGCHTAALIHRALINVGKLDYRNHIALWGMRWVPLWAGGWLFVHACLRNIFVTTRKIGLSTGMGSDHKPTLMLRLRISSEWPIWALNILGAAFPIAEITVSCIAFAFSNKFQNRLIDQSRSLAFQLTTDASAYQSAAFQLQDLSPFFDSIHEIERTESDIALWWRIGTGSLVVSLIIIMIIFIPFFVHHLALLRGLMGARPFWRAFVLDFESVPATLRLSASAVASRSQRDGSHDGPPVLPSIDVLLEQRNIGLSVDRSNEVLSERDAEAMPTTFCSDRAFAELPTINQLPNVVNLQPQPSIKPTVPELSQLVQRDPQDVDLRAEYRRLLLSGLAVWMGQLAYLPIAIWATVANLENTTFNKGELWLTNIAYFPTVLVVNVVLNYFPVWRQIRRSIRQRHRR